MPKPEIVSRVLAEDLPPVTYSPTSFDMPLRRDVIQADIPQATIRTVETSNDPRFPPKKPVQIVHGTLYHGTGSNDPMVVHGTARFKETSRNKNRTRSRKHKKHNPLAQAHELRAEGLSNARAAEVQATGIMDSLTNNINGSSSMVLGVDVLNRRELPELRMHENNAYLHKRLANMRNTPAGVRAAHTIRRLG